MGDVPKGGAGVQVTLVGALLLWLVFVVLLAALVLTISGERNIDAQMEEQGAFIGGAALELTEGLDTRQQIHDTLARLEAASASILLIEVRDRDSVIARVPAHAVPAAEADGTDHIEVVGANGRVAEVVLASAFSSTARLRTTIGTLVSMGLVFVLLSVFMVQFVGRVIGRPLVSLQAQVSQLASGDVSPPTSVLASGELGSIAATLEQVRNRMNDDRRAAHQVSEELRRTNSLQRLMLRELNHRVRNNLASLGSLIHVSRSGVDDVTLFADRIGRRVQVMSAVHDLLSETQWSPVDLATLMRRLVSEEFLPCVALIGDDVDVPATQVGPLAMALQEMFSNAAQHGALSTSTGRVEVSWSLRCTAAHTRLELNWRERGGPAPDADAIARTGTTLIKGLIEGELRGVATLRYANDGVAHLLEIPLRVGAASGEV